jgi:hypothetical protein
MSWPGFLKLSLLTFGLGLGGVFGLTVLMNPFGNLPVRAFGPHVIMDTNDRAQYPAIVRSGNFDSAVIGSSSSKLLEPDRLGQALGGSFANLAMNDGHAWEQYQLALLFLRTAPQARTLLFGIDWVWCVGDAHVNRFSPGRAFPPWIYDDDPWNDWLYILNIKAVETAGLLVANRLGFLKARIPANGFDVFVPPETAYDATKAQRRIWGGKPHAIVAQSPGHAPGDVERASLHFPALAWLADLMARAPDGTRLVLAFMPAHVAVQPQPQSREYAHERECKARIATLATRHRAHLIDFKIRSSLTTEDANYWDPLHYRLPIAHRIIDGIGRAVATGIDDPVGDWVYLAGRQDR